MGKGALYMPLTKQETFKAKLQRHNRLAVPTLLRWRYKMEPGELLKVTVKPLEPESYGEEEVPGKNSHRRTPNSTKTHHENPRAQ